ncbi:hypothetical protein KIPB_014644, partial [Kipferlia bialata]|eukprot:g14644.t1
MVSLAELRERMRSLRLDALIVG